MKETITIRVADDHRILRQKEVLRLLAQGHSTEGLSRYPVDQQKVRFLGPDGCLNEQIGISPYQNRE